MKRLYAEGIFAGITCAFGYLMGAGTTNGVFQTFAFRVTFGIVFGVLCALLIGGGILQHIDRRRFDDMKKRVRVDMGRDKTTITVEPK